MSTQQVVHSRLFIKPVIDHAPWERETSDERLGLNVLGTGCTVWIYEKPDSSTFRYRVFNMVEALRSVAVPATWCRVEEIPALLGKLDHVATIVLARVRYDATVGTLIVAARSRGIRLLFDCDDLVFDTSHVHLLLDTLDLDTQSSAMFDQWFAYVGRLEATAKLCDGGIATNRFLAKQMKEVVTGPIRVVPNFLNRRQQEVSEQLLDTKRASGFHSDEPKVIGYFSGTPSHRRDFAVAIPALVRLLQRDERIRLRIVGFLDDLGPLADFTTQIQRLPLLDWVSLQKAIAEVDINIVPLQDNVFTNCKSELKYFEAAIVGTLTIASETLPFRDALGLQRNGPSLGKVTGADEWDTALEQAVALARSACGYADIVEDCVCGVRERYGWNRSIDLIREAVCEFS